MVEPSSTVHTCRPVSTGSGGGEFRGGELGGELFRGAAGIPLAFAWLQRRFLCFRAARRALASKSKAVGQGRTDQSISSCESRTHGHKLLEGGGGGGGRRGRRGRK
jgi:hypothetical protein